jgi:endonuclease/exonuclease/phosphatase family metal-dependent hydrolase
LSDIFGAGADAAVSWRALAAPPAQAFLRQAEYLESAPASTVPAAEPEDEIDRLFVGGAIETDSDAGNN